jgi:hypothetical protein
MSEILIDCKLFVAVLIAMFLRIKRSGKYEYLQVVRSYREGRKVRQQVIGTLGRRDILTATGELDGLLQSLGKFSSRLKVVEAVRSEGLEARCGREWGLALVFGRLWERQGLSAILPALVAGRRYIVCENPVEARRSPGRT